MSKCASRHSDKFIFRFGLTQEDSLCYHMPDDVESIMAYTEAVDESSAGQFHILDQNPLHHGFF